jgi:hypothetical protein
MTYEQELDIFKDIVDEMVRVFANKRHDYGPTTTETFEKFGPLSMLVRMYDKLGRLTNLLGKEKSFVQESIDDTLMDLANYAVITILELRKEREKHCTKHK